MKKKVSFNNRVEVKYIDEIDNRIKKDTQPIIKKNSNLNKILLCLLIIILLIIILYNFS